MWHTLLDVLGVMHLFPHAQNTTTSTTEIFCPARPLRARDRQPDERATSKQRILTSNSRS